MTQLSAAELQALRKAQDWQGLWVAALPLVKFCVSNLISSGRITKEQATEDLLQEGNRAVGQAVRTWNPDKGAFSTWITYAARGAIFDHIRRVSSGMVGGRRASGNTTQLIEELVQDDGTFEEAPDVLQRVQEAVQVHIAVAGLRSAQDRELIKRYYGIGCEAWQLNEIATTWGFPIRTMKRMLALALKKLALRIVK